MTEPSEKTLSQARKYHVKLTRKLPNSQKRVYKSENELKKQIKQRKLNWSKKGPKCFKTTQVVSELKRHNGASCPKGHERTANFCIKQIAPYKKENVKWFRTLTPNDHTRVVIICPK